MKVQDSIESNPRYFWNFVKEKRKTRDFPTQVNHAGVTSTNSQETAQLFANYFRSIYPTASPTAAFQSSNSPTITSIQLSEYEIRNGLRKLDTSKSAGPDGIPNSVLNSCFDAFAKPLSFLFKSSLNEGCFPSYWKISRVTPIHKKGSKTLVENYRGISILSAVPKFFEALVYDRLYQAIEHKISPHQHGFFKKRSVVTNLCEFTTRLTDWMKKGYQVDCVYTDMSKAFDIAGIDKIIEAACTAGIGGNAVRWIRDYLLNRAQYVKISGSSSHLYKVTSGVPQGSHLGPLLFSLLLNDLPQAIDDVFVLIYVDDVKIFYPVKTEKDCQKLPAALNIFDSYVANCKLNINQSKCAVITYCKRSNIITYPYCFKNQLIKRVEIMQDLGVKLDSSLTFNEHLNTVVSECLAIFAVVRKFAAEFDDPYVIKTLYVSLVRSKLEFASVIWRPMYSLYINKLESVQKKFVRFAVRNLGWMGELPAYNDLCCLLNLDTLENRHKINDVGFFIKILRGHINSEFLKSRIIFNQSTVTLRRRRVFSLENRRTNYTRNEPAYRFMDQVNMLRGIISLDMSIDTIKQKMSLYFRRQLYLV